MRDELEWESERRKKAELGEDGRWSRYLGSGRPGIKLDWDLRGA